MSWSDSDQEGCKFVEIMPKCNPSLALAKILGDKVWGKWEKEGGGSM